MIEKLVKQIKRINKKKNLNINIAVIIGFLLSSGIIYGVDISNPIDSDRTYTADTILDMNGKQIISTGNGNIATPDIEINAAGHKLILNHTTSDILDLSPNGDRGISIFAKTGNLNIKADELVLNSKFTGDKSGEGVLVKNEDGIDSPKKIYLEVKNIEMYINGETEGKDNYGIEARGQGAEIEIQGNLKLEVNSKGAGNGLIVDKGKINIKNEATHITTDSKSWEYGSPMGLLLSSEGEMNIESKTFVLNTISGEGFGASGAFVSDSKLNLNTENTEINTVVTKGGGSYAIQSGGTSKVKIDNKDLLKIITKNIDGDGFTMALSSSSEAEIIINSKNTIMESVSSGTTVGIQTTNKGIIEINGGLEMYQTGGATASVIASGGIVNLNKNNEAVDVKINGQMQASKSGVITLNLNGKDSYFIGRSYIDTNTDGKTNLGISDNAVWKNEGNSKVTKLDFDNGIIDMTHQTAGQRIDIGKISGNNGKIIMDISSTDTDQTKGNTDFISIKEADTEQKHYIEVGGNSIIDLANYDFNKDILIGEASEKIKFEGSKFESFSNVYDYTLELKDETKGAAENNWYITGIEKKESPVTETITDDMSLHYMNAGLARMEADSLHKRLGDIRDLKEGAGVWSRVISGQMESHKNGYFKNDYTMIQAGIDKTETTVSGTWTTGFAVQRREGKADFRNGDGENESTGVALYKSWVGNDNQYLDLVGKYSHLKNEYKSYNSKNEKMEANYHTNAGTLSMEYGKRLSKNNWYVQPHTQMTYTWIEGKNYQTTTKVRAEQQDINSLIGKAGIYAGYDFGKSSHFVKVGVLHEFMGDYGVTIKGEDTSLTKKMSEKDTWLEIGIGGDIKVGKTESTNIYYEIEKTFGGDFETNWQGTIGVRYKF